MRRLFPSLIIATLLSGTGVAVSFAATAPQPAQRSVATARASSVTLITGDRVELAGDGRPQVTPAAGRASMPFRISRKKNHLRVVPGDAAALIAAGRLDERLFDVTSLLDQGYGDAQRADLPLIVQYQPGTPKTAIATATTIRQLPSVDGAAVSVPKKNAPAWWNTAAGGKGSVRALGAVWLRSG